MVIENDIRKTQQDYEELPEGAPYELIHGELVMSPSPSFYHQDISSTLLVLLRQYAEHQHLGKVVSAPIDVYLSEVDVVQPDLLFISNERLHIVQERVMGAPDLVVEILSPSNARYDLWDKRLIYESAGVREYWIVDPERKRVELYENDNGRFIRFAEAEGNGIVASNVLAGFSIEVSTIF